MLFNQKTSGRFRHEKEQFFLRCFFRYRRNDADSHRTGKDTGFPLSYDADQCCDRKWRSIDDPLCHWYTEQRRHFSQTVWGSGIWKTFEQGTGAEPSASICRRLESGTASALKGQSYTAYGKTGSAEITATVTAMPGLRICNQSRLR